MILSGGSPLTLTVPAGDRTFRENALALQISPDLTVSGSDGQNLTQASVSISNGFNASQDRLLFTNQNNITGSYNTTTGILTLTGSATAADYQAALRSVTYSNNSENPTTADRKIDISVAGGFYNPDNGHFYKFVANPGITWTDAKIAAEASDLNGLKGYLATITSAQENSFAFSKVQSVGWIGASDAAVEGEWRWAGGPEAGQQFWQGAAAGSAVGGAYNGWATGEPNNAGNEDYAHFLANGRWNDYANAPQSPVQGYLIEYGGSAGDPTLQLVGSATVKVVSVTETPTVTSPSSSTTVNASTFTLTGTAEAGALVEIYNDANNNGVIDTGETVIASQQLSFGQTSYSINAPLTANAVNNLAAVATANGAEAAAAFAPAITQDSIAPNAPALISPAAEVATTASTYKVVGTAEAGSLVRIYGNLQNGQVGQGSVLLGTQQLASGQTGYEIDVSLTEGANRLGATSTDAAGNVSIVAAASAITLDTVLPVVIATDTVSSVQGRLTQTITFSEIVTGVDRGDFVVTNAFGQAVGGTQITVDPVTGSNGTKYTVEVTGISDSGEYRIDLLSAGTAITDGVGNEQTTGSTGVVVKVLAPSGPSSPSGPTGPTEPSEPTSPTGPTPEALSQFGEIVSGSSVQGVSDLYGLYKAILGRAPDLLGLEGFTATLGFGSTLGDVGTAILNSSEWGAAPQNSQAFVEGLYQNLFGRPADAGGLKSSLEALNAGITPGQLVAQLVTSPEGQAILASTVPSTVFVPDATEASVARLYYGLLDRAPDSFGLGAFSAFVENGGGGAAGEAGRLVNVANAILLSPEYGSGAGSTDAAFIAHLYNGALGRAPDANGASFYANQLAQGVSRATVAMEITQSPEAQVHLVGVIEQGAVLFG